MASNTIKVDINVEELRRVLESYKRPERLDELLATYGETCSLSDAAKIVGCSYAKIHGAIEDGRILMACGGSRVDVRSLAEYIDDRGNADHLARMRRKSTRAAIQGTRRV